MLASLLAALVLHQSLVPIGGQSPPIGERNSGNATAVSSWFNANATSGGEAASNVTGQAQRAVTSLFSPASASASPLPPNASLLVHSRNGNPSGDFFCFQVDQRAEDEKWKIYIILLVPIRRYYFGFSQQKVETAVRIAADASFGWYSYDQVKIASRDSDCNSIAAPLQAMEIFYRKRVNVFIGPVCSVSLAPVARYAGKWNIPVITPGGLAAELTKERAVDFPTLTVVSPIQSFEVARFLFQIFIRFGWRKYVSIYDQNGPEGIEHGYCSLMNRAIEQEQNQQIHFNHLSDSYSSVIEANEMIEKHVSSQFAIIVLCGSLQDIRDILLNALDKGFVREGGGEYVFITIDLHNSPARLHNPWYREGDTPERNERARIAFRANLIITIERIEYSNLTMLMDNVENRYVSWLNESAKNYNTIRNMLNLSQVTLSKEERAHANNYVAAFYNAIILYSQALRSLMTDPVTGALLPKSDVLLKDATNGSKLTAAMRNRTVDGVTGKVIIDGDGNRQTAYTLRAFNPSDNAFDTVARYDSINKQYEPLDGKRIYWPSGVAPPPDTPKCGYDNKRCKTNDHFPEWGIVMIVIGGIFSVLLIVAVFVHRRYKLQKQLFSMNWRVRWNELEPLECPKQQQYGASINSLASPLGANYYSFSRLVARDCEREREIERECRYAPRALNATVSSSSLQPKCASSATLGTAEHRDTFPGSICKHAERETEGDGESKTRTRQASQSPADLVYASPEFPHTCVYKGMVVWLRRIAKYKLEFDTPHLMELKKLKDLSNNHICRFIGVCIDAPNQCIVTEYCHRGSLRDILENEHMHLDWLFKFSLIQDIVRGMLYLHQNVGSHGHLTSGNCLVDTRFVLKITDFGLHTIRTVRQDDTVGARETAKIAVYKKLYRAPELLRMYTPPEEGSREGDVYSFAIVCQEIIYRKGVFYVEKSSISRDEIVQKVRCFTKPPFRPSLSSINSECPEELAQLVKRCWAEEAAQRPDFSGINMHMRRLASREGRSSNILDNLLTRMEQYANNLESLVAARTNDYLEQKKKAEDLLYMMLPRSVALQLIKREPVAAESYDSVTIYFSDVCGFTALSASSTPMQVVDFLNDLYTTFDSIIESFDVYKVETIGDAYMVVSGLPQPNGSLHAREVARMAIALLKEVRSFRIAHRPLMQLKLRIGMHTGPVCAGVVGLKMPRYCLFGDTVNTASRMQSNGAPLRVHISSATKDVLDTFGTFITELRGPVEMKGKGNMITWWLLGERPVPVAETTADGIGVRSTQLPTSTSVSASAPASVSVSASVSAPALATRDEDFHQAEASGQNDCFAHRVSNKVRRCDTDHKISDIIEEPAETEVDRRSQTQSIAMSPKVSLDVSHCPLLYHDSYYSQTSTSPDASTSRIDCALHRVSVISCPNRRSLLEPPDDESYQSQSQSPSQSQSQSDEDETAMIDDGVIMMRSLRSPVASSSYAAMSDQCTRGQRQSTDRVDSNKRNGNGEARDAEISEMLHLL